MGDQALQKTPLSSRALSVELESMSTPLLLPASAMRPCSSIRSYVTMVQAQPYAAYSKHLPVLCSLRILASRLILLYCPAACFRLASVRFCFARLFFCLLYPSLRYSCLFLVQDVVGSRSVGHIRPSAGENTHAEFPGSVTRAKHCVWALTS
jgi:hypothetical protein